MGDSGFTVGAATHRDHGDLDEGIFRCSGGGALMTVYTGNLFFRWSKDREGWKSGVRIFFSPFDSG